MSYLVEITAPAQRGFDDLPPKARQRVADRLRELAADPRPHDAAPLRSTLRGSFRLRVGDYRIAYQVDDRSALVRVWQVGHRSKFYDMAARRNR